MNMPGFTAETALSRSGGYYYGSAAPSSASGLVPALVAPTVCRTSPCLTVGPCKIKVRCCRNFQGICSCRTVSCSFLGPPDTAG